MEMNTEFVKEVRDWFAEWKEQDKTFGFHQGVKYAMQACDRIEQVIRERDLAIAHDRQPYPTAEAYEKVCKALHKKEAKIEQQQTCIKKLIDVAKAFVDVAEHTGEEEVDFIKVEIAKAEELLK